ncbi:ZBED5 protein, partial [Crocuta crocuta]
QWDKSRDVAELAVLHVFIHYQPQLKIINDLSWEHLATKNTELNNFFTKSLLLGQKHKVLNNFLESHGLSWNKSADICVDDTKARVDKTAGTLARLEAVVLNCSIFFHAQFRNKTKQKPDSLRNVFDEATKVVNFMKTQ